MFSSMSLFRRSFFNSTRSWVRCLHSSASRASGGPRNTLLNVPKRSVDLDTMKNKVKDSYANRETPTEFLKHRETMKKLFPGGWNPRRKLSREAMDGLRALHRHDPEKFSTPVLAERFCISPEAVRRILKAKWIPNKMEKAEMLKKERRRKQEYIRRRIERERADKWEQLDSHQQPEEPKRQKDDELSLV